MTPATLTPTAASKPTFVTRNAVFSLARLDRY
jgi:hypothetical protein